MPGGSPISLQPFTRNGSSGQLFTVPDGFVCTLSEFLDLYQFPLWKPGLSTHASGAVATALLIKGEWKDHQLRSQGLLRLLVATALLIKGEWKDTNSPVFYS